jgi:hypothetical protein
VGREVKARDWEGLESWLLSKAITAGLGTLGVRARVVLLSGLGSYAVLDRAAVGMFR